MTITLNRVDDAFQFVAKNAQNASIIMDASSSIGGSDLGMRPMEVLASSLAGCCSIDILSILYKQKQIVSDYAVLIAGDRSSALPGVFTNLHLTINLTGDIDIKKAQKAAALSFKKYCSVAKMLEPNCVITYTIDVS